MTRPVSCPSALALSARDPSTYQTMTTNEKGAVQEAETLESQIDRLADVIMDEVPGEPSQNEGAVDTAIRVIRQMLHAQSPPLLPVARDEDITDTQRLDWLEAHGGIRIHETFLGGDSLLWWNPSASERHHVSSPDDDLRDVIDAKILASRSVPPLGSDQ